MCRYHLGLVDADGGSREDVAGKMLRPALCLAMCEAQGGDIRRCLPAALSIELIHRTSLVFDDIRDHSPQRNHQPSLWEMWGPDQAINVGLALSGYARLALHGMVEQHVSLGTVLEIHRLLEQTAIDMSRGQHTGLRFQQVTSPASAPTLSEYLEMVRMKTSALVGAACEVGTLVAEANNQRETARSFGESLGVAFQLQDDSLGVWGKEANLGKLPADLEQRKWGLPAILAMEQMGSDVFDLMRAPPQDHQATRSLGAILGSQNVRRRAEELTASTARRSQTLLAKLALAPAWKDGLRALAEFVATRPS